MKIKILQLDKQNIEYLYNNVIEVLFFKFSLPYSKIHKQNIEFYVVLKDIEGFEVLYKLLKNEYNSFEDFIKNVDKTVHIFVDVQSPMILKTFNIYNGSYLFQELKDKCHLFLVDKNNNFTNLLKYFIEISKNTIAYYNEYDKTITTNFDFDCFRFTFENITSNSIISTLRVDNGVVYFDEEDYRRYKDYIFNSAIEPTQKIIPLLLPQIAKIVKLFTDTINFGNHIKVIKRTKEVNIKKMFFVVYKYYNVLKYYMFLLVNVSNEEMKQVLSFTTPEQVISFWASKIVAENVENKYEYLKKNLNRYKDKIKKAYYLVNIVVNDEFVKNILDVHNYNSLTPTLKYVLLKYLFYTRDVIMPNYEKMYYRTQIIDGKIYWGVELWGWDKENYVKLAEYLYNYKRLVKLLSVLQTKMLEIRKLSLDLPQKIKRYNTLSKIVQHIETSLQKISNKKYNLLDTLQKVNDIENYHLYISKFIALINTINSEYNDNNSFERKILEYLLNNYKISMIVKFLKHSFFTKISYNESIRKFITKFKFHSKLKKPRLNAQIVFESISDMFPYTYYRETKYNKPKNKIIKLFRKVFNHYNTISNDSFNTLIAYFKNDKIYLHIKYYITNNTVFRDVRVCYVKYKDGVIYDVRSADENFEYILNLKSLYTPNTIDIKYFPKNPNVKSYFEYVLENCSYRKIIGLFDYLNSRITHKKSIIPLTYKTNLNLNIIRFEE